MNKLMHFSGSSRKLPDQQEQSIWKFAVFFCPSKKRDGLRMRAQHKTVKSKSCGYAG